MTDQPHLDPDDGAYRRSVLAAAAAGEKVRGAVLDRAIALAYAVQRGATVAELSAAVGLTEEQVQTIVDRTSQVEPGTREARQRQAERLVDHARKRRDDAEHSLRAAMAFAAELSYSDDPPPDRPAGDD